MPQKRKSNLSRNSRAARRFSLARKSLLGASQDYATTSRATETLQQHEARLAASSDHATTSRATESVQARDERLANIPTPVMKRRLQTLRTRRSSDGSPGESKVMRKASTKDGDDKKGIRTRLSTGTLVMSGTSTTSPGVFQGRPSSPSSSSGGFEESSILKDAQETPLAKRRQGEGQDDGSRPILPPRTRRTGQDNRNDYYCWICHKEGLVICCELCPRVYHSKCLNIEEVPRDWVCPECEKIMQEECTATRSKAMSEITIDRLCSLLNYALDRMRTVGTETFEHPVNLTQFPSYPDYIFHPMSLGIIEKNIRKKMYGCAQALLADAKWIFHNSVIYNGVQSKITSTARTLLKVCKHEVSEIEVCPDCYWNSCVQGDEAWFCEPCGTPHPLVWAKLQGYPFWPAKALREVEGRVDVRFFGAHDRSWVSTTSCFMISKESPVALRKGRSGLATAMRELEMHVTRLREKTGCFEYAAPRVPYNAGLMSKMLMGNSCTSGARSSLGAVKGRTVLKSREGHSSDKQSVASKKANAVKSKYSTLTSKKGTQQQQPIPPFSQRQVIYLKPIQKGVFLLTQPDASPMTISSTLGKTLKPCLPDLQLIKRIENKINPVSSSVSTSKTSATDTIVNNNVVNNKEKEGEVATKSNEISTVDLVNDCDDLGAEAARPAKESTPQGSSQENRVPHRTSAGDKAVRVEKSFSEDTSNEPPGLNDHAKTSAQRSELASTAVSNPPTSRVTLSKSDNKSLASPVEGTAVTNQVDSSMLSKSSISECGKSQTLDKESLSSSGDNNSEVRPTGQSTSDTVSLDKFSGIDVIEVDSNVRDLAVDSQSTSAGDDIITEVQRPVLDKDMVREETPNSSAATTSKTALSESPTPMEIKLSSVSVSPSPVSSSSVVSDVRTTSGLASQSLSLSKSSTNHPPSVQLPTTTGPPSLLLSSPSTVLSSRKKAPVAVTSSPPPPSSSSSASLTLPPSVYLTGVISSSSDHPASTKTSSTVPTAASSSPGSNYRESLQKVIDSCKAKLGIASDKNRWEDDDDVMILGDDEDEEEVSDDEEMTLLMDVEDKEKDQRASTDAPQTVSNETNRAIVEGDNKGQGRVKDSRQIGTSITRSLEVPEPLHLPTTLASSQTEGQSGNRNEPVSTSSAKSITCLDSEEAVESENGNCAMTSLSESRHDEDAETVSASLDVPCNVQKSVTGVAVQKHLEPHKASHEKSYSDTSTEKSHKDAAEGEPLSLEVTSRSSDKGSPVNVPSEATCLGEERPSQCHVSRYGIDGDKDASKASQSVEVTTVTLDDDDDDDKDDDNSERGDNSLSLDMEVECGDVEMIEDDDVHSVDDDVYEDNETKTVSGDNDDLHQNTEKLAHRVKETVPITQSTHTTSATTTLSKVGQSLSPIMSQHHFLVTSSSILSSSSKTVVSSNPTYLSASDVTTKYVAGKRPLNTTGGVTVPAHGSVVSSQQQTFTSKDKFRMPFNDGAYKASSSVATDKRVISLDNFEKEGENTNGGSGSSNASSIDSRDSHTLPSETVGGGNQQVPEVLDWFELDCDDDTCDDSADVIPSSSLPGRSTSGTDSSSTVSSRLNALMEKRMKQIEESLASHLQGLAGDIEWATEQSSQRDVRLSDDYEKLLDKNSSLKAKLADATRINEKSQKEMQAVFDLKCSRLTSSLKLQFSQELEKAVAETKKRQWAVFNLKCSKLTSSLKLQFADELEKTVAETKKHQWCSECWKEAVYYCCWNTSYCSYICQQKHWPSHMPKCLQAQPTTQLSLQTQQTPETSTQAQQQQQLKIASFQSSVQMASNLPVIISSLTTTVAATTAINSCIPSASQNLAAAAAMAKSASFGKRPTVSIVPPSQWKSLEEGARQRDNLGASGVIGNASIDNASQDPWQIARTNLTSLAPRQAGTTTGVQMFNPAGNNVQIQVLGPNTPFIVPSIMTHDQGTVPLIQNTSLFPLASAQTQRQIGHSQQLNQAQGSRYIFSSAPLRALQRQRQPFTGLHRPM